MAITESQKESIARYRAEKRDRLSTDIPKGKRDVYNAAAKELKLSLAQLIQNGVEEYIKNHGGEVVVPAARQETETISAEERRLIQSFANLPDNMKPTLRKLIDQLAQSSSST